MRSVLPRSMRLLLAAGAVGGVALVAGLVSAQPAPPEAPPTGPQGLEAAAPPDEEAPPSEIDALPPEPPPPIRAERAEPPPEEESPTADAAKAPEAPPAKRIRHNVAILQVLDKITAETLRFEAEVGRPVRYKNLVFTARACERTTSDEPMEDAIAYLVIESQPRAQPGRSTPPARQAFRGWMYASSPGLNPLEHPVYDAWVITCRAPVPAQVAAAPKSASIERAADSRR